MSKQEASAMKHASQKTRSWTLLRTIRKSCRSSRGFTLLEILIALVILSIGVLGYMAVQFQSVNSRAFAKTLHRAMTTGITNLEELRTVDFAQMSGEGIEYFDRITGLVASEADYDEGRAYKAEWSVADWSNVSPNPNCFINEMKSLQVVVRWKEKGINYSSVFFTFERGRKTGDIS
jgi:prepilin-type N-terminal cleavage/methylation domain-containing protein